MGSLSVKGRSNIIYFLNKEEAKRKNEPYTRFYEEIEVYTLCFFLLTCTWNQHGWIFTPQAEQIWIYGRILNYRRDTLLII